MARKDGKDRGIVEKPKGSGNWWVRLYVDGRERWHKCDSKSQARTLYGRLKGDAREGKYFPERYKPHAVPKPLLLREYFETWLKNQPARGKKPITIKTYEWRIRKHVLPVFGRLALPAITRPHIKTWATTLLETLDYDTALNVVLTLSAILSEAVEDGIIPQNPALRSGKLLKRPPTLEEQELAIFTPDEEGVFLETVQRQRPLFYPMALTFFRTGLRAGEVMGLHREDLDFRHRSIHCRRNWSHWRLGTPKNGKARKVDMSQGLAKVLREWIEIQDLEAAAAGQSAPEILFPGNVGGTRRQRSYMAENFLRYKLWFPMTETAGMRRLDLHAARHTFASRLIQNGANLKYVSEQLGHASIAITVDTYGHLIPGGNRTAVDRLDEIGTGSKTGSEASSKT
jgi:integrase